MAILLVATGILFVTTPAQAHATCEYRPANQTVVVHLEQRYFWWMRLSAQGEIVMYRHPRMHLDCGLATVGNTHRVVVRGGASTAMFGLDNRGAGGVFPPSITVEVREAYGVAIQGTDGPDRFFVHRNWIDTAGARFRFPPSARVYLTGGAGDDRIDAGTKVGGFMSIRGQQGNDRLIGRRGHDLLQGGGGDDRLVASPFRRGTDAKDDLWGEEGDDVLLGGTGKDDLWGGSGSDVIRGGRGYDAISWLEGPGPVTVDVLAGTVSDSADTDTVGGIEQFTLTYSSDVFSGGPGDELVWGANGPDTISGGAGSDRLMGGTGNDSLSGEEGDDRLRGQEGADIAAGGDGTDVCAAESVNDCES